MWWHRHVELLAADLWLCAYYTQGQDRPCFQLQPANPHSCHPHLLQLAVLKVGVPLLPTAMVYCMCCGPSTDEEWLRQTGCLAPTATVLPP